MQNIKKKPFDVEVLCKKIKIADFVTIVFMWLIQSLVSFGWTTVLVAILTIYIFYSSSKTCKKILKEHSNKKISDKVIDNTIKTTENQICKEQNHRTSYSHTR